jgi:hypothetical protein
MSLEDTILAISTEDPEKGVIAIGYNRVYLLKGKKTVSYNGQAFIMKPGMCYDYHKDKIYLFNIKDFVEKYSKDFPGLSDRIIIE